MTRREWWNGRFVMVLAPLAAALPLIWPRIPPLADLPGHLASYHVSVALAYSAALQRFFAFDWHLIGNLGVDLLVVPLAALIGVEPATKVIVLAIPALTALALLLLARQTHGRLPATALFAVPLAYNDPFNFGFVNYSLAAALALLGFALWRRWPTTHHAILRGATFVVFAALVWLCHASGWMMLATLCGVTELQRRLAAYESIAGALIGTTLACLGLALPIVLNFLGPHADHASAGGWLWPGALSRAVIGALRDRWIIWDVGSIALLLALIAAALFRVTRLRLAPALAWPAAVLAALFVILPMRLNGSDYFNTRLFPYALALGIIAVDTNSVAPWRRSGLAVAAALFCAARLMSNTASFYLYDASYTRELAAIDHVPYGARVLTLVNMPCKKQGQGWTKHRLEHVSAMATVRRDAFVNELWTIEGLQLLRDRMPQAAPFRYDPSQFVASPRCVSFPPAQTAFRTAPLAAFTHLWLIGVPAAERPHDRRLLPVWAAGDSVLYRIALPPPRGSSFGRQQVGAAQ